MRALDAEFCPYAVAFCFSDREPRLCGILRLNDLYDEISAVDLEGPRCGAPVPQQDDNGQPSRLGGVVLFARPVFDVVFSPTPFRARCRDCNFAV